VSSFNSSEVGFSYFIALLLISNDCTYYVLCIISVQSVLVQISVHCTDCTTQATNLYIAYWHIGILAHPYSVVQISE